MDKYFLISENLKLTSKIFSHLCMLLTDAKNITLKEYSEQKVFKHNIMWCPSVSSNRLEFQRTYDWPAHKLPNNQY